MGRHNLSPNRFLSDIEQIQDLKNRSEGILVYFKIINRQLYIK